MRRSSSFATIAAVALVCATAGFIAGLLHAGKTGDELLGIFGVTPHLARAEEAAEPAPERVATVRESDAPAAAGPARILLAGDVLPLGDRDYFAAISSLVRSADLAICNLECPVSTHGERSPLKLTTSGRAMHNEYLFRAPPSQARRLAEAGFDGVTLANNHIMDFGGEALLETLRLLEQAGVQYTGAGPDRTSARQPMILSAAGHSVAVLAYVSAKTLPGTEGFAASDETAGTVFVRGDASGRPDATSSRMLRNDIRAAAKRADVVIACFHWGTEGADEPDPLQRSLAHLAIDAGADAVIGHHPHRLQGVEIYRDRPIAYSLGNFAFPTPWESNHFSAALELRVERGEWSSLVFHPVLLEFRVGDPAPARGADAERIITRLTRLSEALGTTCRRSGEPLPRVWVDRPESAGGALTAAQAQEAFGIEPHPELRGMATVSFAAWDVEGGGKVARPRTVVVTRKLADEVLAIFREIYEDDERFPIHEVIGYDYRTIAGSQDRLSFHALGRAIDINRAQNPMIQDGEKIVHPDEPPYVPGEWRPREDPYSIPAEGSVVRAFTSRGWRWGGTWTSCRDYQHFDRPG